MKHVEITRKSLKRYKTSRKLRNHQKPNFQGVGGISNEPGGISNEPGRGHGVFRTNQGLFRTN